MLEKGDLITLNNQEQYIVVNQLIFEGKYYVYLVTKDGFSNILFCQLENSNLKVIKDEALIKILLEKFKNN